MWAFYGKEARKLERNHEYNIQDFYKLVNDKFKEADVGMMCEKFLNKKALASRDKMNDAILNAYAKGPQAHSKKQTEHTQTM